MSEPSSLSAHLRSGFLPVPPSLFHLMALGSMSPWRHLTHQGGHRPYYTGHGHTGCRAQHGGHQSKDIPARTGGCLSAKPAGGLLVCAHRGLGRDRRTLSRSSSYVPSPTACAERGNSGKSSLPASSRSTNHAMSSWRAICEDRVFLPRLCSRLELNQPAGPGQSGQGRAPRELSQWLPCRGHSSRANVEETVFFFLTG